jgi:hypothetical protein
MFSNVCLTFNPDNKKFEIQGRYHNDWPIRDALKLRLKYTSDWEKKKESRKIEANLKKALNVKD